MNFVRYAVEGPTDEPIVKKILLATGLEPFQPLIANGKSNLDQKLPDLNRIATSIPWLVVRDLDHDDERSCIPVLRENLLGNHQCNQFMRLRFAVRAIEAWLMADHDAFTEFFGIRRKVEQQPESLDNPKRYLINICRKSTKKRIKEGIPPPIQSKRTLGPDYVTLIRKFAEDRWDPLKARVNAPSLGRALDSLTKLRGLLEQPDGSPYDSTHQ